MRYQHIVFDVDGTLLDTESANLRSLQDTLRQVSGQAPPQEELTFSLGIPGVDALTRLGIADVAGTLRLWEEKLSNYRHLISVFPGIPELLRELSRRELGLGVATSRTRREFNVDFDHLEFTPLLKITVCTEDTALHKPNADPLLHYMARAKAQPEEVLYIGDSLYDMQCAANAGADFALAGWGATEVLNAPHILRHPQDVLALLD